MVNQIFVLKFVILSKITCNLEQEFDCTHHVNEIISIVLTGTITYNLPVQISMKKVIASSFLIILVQLCIKIELEYCIF